MNRSVLAAGPSRTRPNPATNIQVMISCKNTSIAELGQFLQQQANVYFDHPVVYATGLDGNWNFMMAGHHGRPCSRSRPRM